MAAALLAAVLFFPVSAVSAKNAILVDATTGRVLYEKQAHQQGLIASTTKIMTALVVCEQCNVLDRVRIPAEAVGVEGSSMYLLEGEVLTIQENGRKARREAEHTLQGMEEELKKKLLETNLG